MPPRSKPNPETITISAFLGRLKIGQAVALGTGILALIGGAGGFGAYIQSGRDEERAAVQARALTDANTRINELSGQITDLKRGLTAIGDALRSSEITRQSLEGEVEFLNRYVSYVSRPR